MPMTADELADRTRRAAQAALDAARTLGLQVTTPRVLHDVFSVVVHLEPEPVVARIPVVLPPGTTLDDQVMRQQRELDVVAWLDQQGIPVGPPSARVPRSPVCRDGFCMTFWQLADVADDHAPYASVEIARSAELHAALASYLEPLPFLSPFNWAVPSMLAALDDSGPLTLRDIARARAEYEVLRPMLSDRAAFEAKFPGVGVQAIQGDAPSHNVIRTTGGMRFSDFEDVTCGPVEWDLAMLGPQACAEYDDAARELGLRVTDPEVQRLMDAARSLQLIGCLALVPQLPVLADGLAPMVESWRAAPPLE
jgi:Phosphotransferase enzyme family